MLAEILDYEPADREDFTMRGLAASSAAVKGDNSVRPPARSARYLDWPGQKFSSSGSVISIGVVIRAASSSVRVYPVDLGEYQSLTVLVMAATVHFLG